MQGNYPEAIDYMDTQSLIIREEIGDKLGIAMSLNSLGLFYKKQGYYAKALDYSKRSLSIAQEVGAALATKGASRSLIFAYTLLDSTNRAVEMTDLLQSLRLKDLDINFSILSEQEKETYFTTMQRDFDILYDFAKHHSQFTQQTEKSFNNALLTKGLTLKSSTAMRQAIQNSGDSSLIKQYEDWLALKKKIAKLNETDSTYKDLVNQANEKNVNLVKRSTIFSDFDKVKNVKWQDVQAGLKPNEAAIEFVHFKSEIDTANPIIYAAFIVKKDSKHPEMIRLCTEAELKEILGVFQGNNLSFVKGVYGTKNKSRKSLV
jgi:tetratricopeptide (TPR) repeat protein